MCNFNNVDEQTKEKYYFTLTEYLSAFDGKGDFFNFLEDIRGAKPHPLTIGRCIFISSSATIRWNKIIFADKIDLLIKVRTQESKTGNLLPKKDDKNYKKVLNLVRTLSPMIFELTTKDGRIFNISPFENIDKNTTRLDPIFDAIFFCAVNTLKQVLNHKSKTEQ